MGKSSARQALIDKMGVPVIQATVTSGSVNTAYLAAGAGTPVVCLHGGGAGAVTWYPAVAALAEHFHVVAPDIVGYGESDKPDARYDKAFFSHWLKQFLHAVGLAKAHVIGLSQGGAVALQFALDCPEMVDKLVLVDSGGLGAKPPLMSLLSMLWLNTFPSSLANHVYARYILFDPARRDPDHARYSLEVLRRAGGKKAFSQGRGAAVSAFSSAALGSIQHRTLLIWGEDDRLFPVACAAKAAALMPNATLCRIANAGHLPLMDQPAAFNQAVMSFLLAR